MRRTTTSQPEKQQEPSFGERLSSALQSVLSGISSVLQELVIFIVAAIPVLLVLALLASPFFFWFRYKLKRSEKERLERHPDMRRHDRDVFKQAYKDGTKRQKKRQTVKSCRMERQTT